MFGLDSYSIFSFLAQPIRHSFDYGCYDLGWYKNGSTHQAETQIKVSWQLHYLRAQ